MALMFLGVSKGFHFPVKNKRVSEDPSMSCSPSPSGPSAALRSSPSNDMREGDSVRRLRVQ